MNEYIIINGVKIPLKDNVNGYNRIIMIYAGMTGEFEVIKTNAPNEVIEEQLRANAKDEHVDPYDIIEANGYYVDCLGCHDDLDIEDLEIDKKFDYYDYFDLED